jgi:DNA-binding PadR family transcriptional regulator
MGEAATYELMILSLLMRSPMHGYLIAKITNDQIGPWAKISSGTLYTILTRLEQAGFIAVLPQAHESTRPDHHSRTFTITEEGRKRFHQVMMDTSSNLGDYQKLFHFKLCYIDLLQRQERLLLLNHYINYCQTSVLYLHTEMESLVHELAGQSNRAFLENVLRVMTHMAEQWQAELAWARTVREQEMARVDAPAPTASPDQGQAARQQRDA